MPFPVDAGGGQRAGSQASGRPASATDPRTFNSAVQQAQASAVPTPQSVEAAIKEVEQDLDSEERSIRRRSWLQASADGVSRLWGGQRSDVETYLENKLKSLQELEARMNPMSTSDFNAQYANLMGNFNAQLERLSEHEAASDQRWGVATEITRGAVATAVGVGVTLATGGNVALGAAAGFGTYQAMDAVQDIETAASGGNIEDNNHVSLVGLGIDLVNHKASWAEAKHAGRDVLEDGVSAIVNAYGASAAKGVSAWAASRAVPTLVAKVAPTAATKIGLAGLEMAAPTATAAEVAAIAAGNSAKSIGVRIASTATAATANQAVQAGGQLVNKAVDLASRGQLLTAEGGKAMVQELENHGFDLATAPVAAGFNGALPAHRIVLQAGAYLATNLVQSEGRALVIDHRHMNGDDALAVAISTVPGTLQRLAAHPLGAAVIRRMVRTEAATSAHASEPPARLAQGTGTAVAERVAPTDADGAARVGGNETAGHAEAGAEAPVAVQAVTEPEELPLPTIKHSRGTIEITYGQRGGVAITMNRTSGTVTVEELHSGTTPTHPKSSGQMIAEAVVEAGMEPRTITVAALDIETESAIRDGTASPSDTPAGRALAAAARGLKGLVTETYVVSKDGVPALAADVAYDVEAMQSAARALPPLREVAQHADSHTVTWGAKGDKIYVTFAIAAAGNKMTITDLSTGGLLKGGQWNAKTAAKMIAMALQKTRAPNKTDRITSIKLDASRISARELPPNAANEAMLELGHRLKAVLDATAAELGGRVAKLEMMDDAFSYRPHWGTVEISYGPPERDDPLDLDLGLPP